MPETPKTPQGDVLDEVHRTGIVHAEEYRESGTFVDAHLPAALARRLEQQR